MTATALKEDPTATSAAFAHIRATLESLADLDDGDAMLSFYEELGVKMEQFRNDLTGLFQKYRHFQTAIERCANNSPGDIDLLALALTIREFDFAEVRSECEMDELDFVVDDNLAGHLKRLASHG